MNPQLNINYVKLDNNLILPYYIYNKLLILNSDTNNMHKLISYYNTHIFYTSIKTKILKFAINLFDVDCELWSNPFICMRQFCSNNDVDSAYGGIDPLHKLNPEKSKKKCALLVDQRPLIDAVPKNIDCTHTNAIFSSKLKYAIQLVINSPTSYPFTLVVASLNQITFPSLPSNVKLNSFNINNNMFLYFVQTLAGYKHVTPSNTKIDILISFVRNKEAVSNLQTKIKQNHIILGSRRTAKRHASRHLADQ